MLNFAAQAARDCRRIESDLRTPIHRTASAGDRASPRQHLRRGHVRHLADGRRIWIQPALVGDPANGRIRKFYDVRTAA